MTSRSLGRSTMLATMAMAMAALPSDGPVAVLTRRDPAFEIPRSALGAGARCRPSNKGAYASTEEKKRRRKLALASKRRNRRRV